VAKKRRGNKAVGKTKKGNLLKSNGTREKVQNSGNGGCEKLGLGPKVRRGRKEKYEARITWLFN